MVFDKIKDIYSKRKESIQTKKELDNLLKEKARARAEEAYKQKVVEDRQRYMQDREEKLYEQELKKQGKTGYEDTRTKTEKFKEFGSKVGAVGQKITSDTKMMGSNLSTPDVSRFSRKMEGSLGEEQPYQTPVSNRRRYKEQPYQTPLPRMSRSRESLPPVEQKSMFFRSGPMYDDTDRLNNNLNVFSQKLNGGNNNMGKGMFSNLGLGNDKTESKLRNFLK